VLPPFPPQQGTLSLCENSFVILSAVTCAAPPSDTVVFLAGLTTGTALLESDLPEPGTLAAPGDRALLIPFPAPFFSIGEFTRSTTTEVSSVIAFVFHWSSSTSTARGRSRTFSLYGTLEPSSSELKRDRSL
jgi:hypothetical protein